MNAEILSAASSAGATPPSPADHSPDERGECLNRWRHAWVWENFLDLGQPLRARCSTCSESRAAERWAGQ